MPNQSEAQVNKFHVKEAHGVYFGGSLLIGYYITATSVIVFRKVYYMKMSLALSRRPTIQTTTKTVWGVKTLTFSTSRLNSS